MTKALKAFETEIKKVDDRVAELKAANKKDVELLQKLEVDYEQAVNSFQSDNIDKLHGEITATKQNMDNRSRQISILESPDNPVRKKAKVELVEILKNERSAIREQADAVHKEAMKAKDTYLSIVSQINEINRVHKEADRALLRANGVGGYGEGYLSGHAYTVELGEIIPLGGKK